MCVIQRLDLTFATKNLGTDGWPVLRAWAKRDEAALLPKSHRREIQELQSFLGETGGRGAVSCWIKSLEGSWVTDCWDLWESLGLQEWGASRHSAGFWDMAGVHWRVPRHCCRSWVWASAHFQTASCVALCDKCTKQSLN